jgi:hypothetical protein
LVDGVAGVGCSNLSDARSTAIAIGHCGTSAGGSGGGGAGGIGRSHAVNRLAWCVHAGLCDIAGDTSVQIVNLINSRENHLIRLQGFVIENAKCLWILENL